MFASEPIASGSVTFTRGFDQDDQFLPVDVVRAVWLNFDRQYDQSAVVFGYLVFTMAGKTFTKPFVSQYRVFIKDPLAVVRHLGKDNYQYGRFDRIMREHFADNGYQYPAPGRGQITDMRVLVSDIVENLNVAQIRERRIDMLNYLPNAVWSHSAKYGI